MHVCVDVLLRVVFLRSLDDWEVHGYMADASYSVRIEIKGK